MRVFAFCVHELAELALCGQTATNHCLRAVDGRLPKHVLPARALDRLRDFQSPVDDFIWIGQRNQRNGTVDVFVRVQDLQALRSVEPWLRDDNNRVHIGFAEFIQTFIAVLFADLPRHERIVEELLDFFRLAVAEGDFVNQRMRLEEFGELRAE